MAVTTMNNRRGVTCTHCDGVGVLIDRFDHSNSYDCPLCGGTGRITGSLYTKLKREVMNEFKFVMSELYDKKEGAEQQAEMYPDGSPDERLFTGRAAAYREAINLVEILADGDEEEWLRDIE